MAFSPSHILELTRAAFRQEAEELLSELDTAMLQVEANPKDAAQINRAFRATHTLKGSGATAGFERVSALLHGVEDTLNEAREGRAEISAGIVDHVLRITDVVRRMLQGSESDPALLEEGRSAVQGLAGLRPERAEAAPRAPEPPAESSDRGGVVQALRFAPQRTIFHSGNDPLVMLRELSALGAMVVRARLFAVPSLLELDPELCYLSFDAQIATTQPAARLRDVFAFVEDDAEIELSRVPAAQAWVLPPLAYFDPEAVDDFLEEGAENVAELEAEILALEENPADFERIESAFRALHNLKGQTGLLLSEMRLAAPPDHPLLALRDLCHAVEGFAERHRGPARQELDEGGIQLLLQAVDRFKALLGDFVHARPSSASSSELLSRISGRGPPLDARLAAAPAPSVFASVVSQCRAVVGAILRPGERTEPLSTGEIRSASRALQTLLRAADYESAAVVAGRAEGLLATCRELLVSSAPGAEGAPGGEGLARLVVEYAGLEAALRDGEAPRAIPSVRPLGRTISIRPSRPPKPSERAPALVAGDGAVAARSVRVDQSKLDRLMRAVGELLVARNSFPTFAKRLERERHPVSRDVKDVGDRISHIADDLQDAVMAIRMMPIRALFQRFPRMIRDLARSEGKSVQLIVSGEETELDKTVLEQLTDPLVHLVRNAVDHGIGSPAERSAAGKPELGTVALKVSREGNFVLIEISDDGRGMSEARLRDKAVERGLLTRAAADALPREAVHELVFLPGFSTAEKVTSISGRGVGMDVVRNNVRQLHGTIAIESALGAGSTFRIKLPASLMVAKAILVEASGEQFVFPIESVREMVKLEAKDIHGLADLRFVHIRGSVCPIVSLASLLGLPVESAGAESGLRDAAIVRTRRGDVALLVDRLVSEIDVIVKPLSEGLDRLRLYQGASILGDGRVALVLDTLQLGAALPAPDASRGGA